MSRMQLTVVSQERELIRTSAESITVPGVEGELTILPGHIPLVTRLKPGVITYLAEGKNSQLAVSRGFITVNHGNEVIVMVDSAMHAREISSVKAQEAVKRATEAVKLSDNQRERLKAEAELRFALLQLNIAERSKKSPV